jgi:hypothetical protein
MMSWCAVATAGPLGWPPAARAQTLTLVDITTTADRLCNIVRLEGAAKTTKYEGAVKAEVDGLLNKLGVDTDAGGTAAQSASNYQGFAQNDLLPALRDNTNCKLHVFDVLATRLPSIQSQSPAQSPGAGEAAAGAVIPPRSPPEKPPPTDRVNFGRWTTSLAGDCTQKYYFWSVKGQYMEFVDQSNQIDIEKVLAVRPDGISSMTVQSNHRDGGGESSGTRWDYSFDPSGKIAVTSSGGKRFWLRPCEL